jgi:hypothetical protein
MKVTPLNGSASHPDICREHLKGEKRRPATAAAPESRAPMCIPFRPPSALKAPDFQGIGQETGRHDFRAGHGMAAPRPLRIGAQAP